MDRGFDVAFCHILDGQPVKATTACDRALKRLEALGSYESGWHLEAAALKLLSHPRAGQQDELIEILTRAEEAHSKEGEMVAAGRVRSLREMVERGRLISGIRQIIRKD